MKESKRKKRTYTSIPDPDSKAGRLTGLELAEAVQKVREMKASGFGKATIRSEINPKRGTGGKRNYLKR